MSNILYMKYIIFCYQVEIRNTEILRKIYKKFCRSRFIHSLRNTIHIYVQRCI